MAFLGELKDERCEDTTHGHGRGRAPGQDPRRAGAPI